MFTLRRNANTMEVTSCAICMRTSNPLSIISSLYSGGADITASGNAGGLAGRLSGKTEILDCQVYLSPTRDKLSTMTASPIKHLLTCSIFVLDILIRIFLF